MAARSKITRSRIIGCCRPLEAGDHPRCPSQPRRKRLADITNLSIDSSAVTSSFVTSTGKENLVSITAGTSTKDTYIAQLLNENNALIRALGERNKLIELSATEIKNVRCALQKLM